MVDHNKKLEKSVVKAELQLSIVKVIKDYNTKTKLTNNDIINVLSNIIARRTE